MCAVINQELIELGDVHDEKAETKLRIGISRAVKLLALSSAHALRQKQALETCQRYPLHQYLHTALSRPADHHAPAKP